MRQLYEVESSFGTLRQEADRLTITPHGDLTFVDITLISKDIQGKNIMVEDPCPTLVLAKGQWTKLNVIKK